MAPIIGVEVAGDPGPGGPLLAGRRLYYLEQEYALAVERAGGVPVLLPRLHERGNLQRLLARLDGVLVTGAVQSPSPDTQHRLIAGRQVSLARIDPARYQFAQRLIDGALRRRLPVLGICRGAQQLALTLGCSLGTCLGHRSEVGWMKHPIRVVAGSRLHATLQSDWLLVNSHHRQAIAATPEDVAVSAVAPDGVIEAVESRRHPFAVGVQFHPEQMLDDGWLPLFGALCQASSSP